jgi:glycerol-3-phosphate acyltransferase PlsX
MRIAIDAMGGDFSPRSPVEGALHALGEGLPVEIVLVGPRERIQKELESLGGSRDGLGVHDAPTVIEPGERPLQAVRNKPDSSICQCAQLLVDGRADAMISAGNTGACVTSASLMLKRLDGVRRPGIVTFLPTVDGKVAVIDVGANIKCRPEHLFQYGVMGSVYAHHMVGIEKPRIAILNIGSEDAKGNELVKNTHRIFLESDVNFTGNIEGQDVFLGRADVVVTEGFVGNTVLKVSEGLAESINLSLAEFARSAGKVPEETEAILSGIRWLRQQTDYEESGGAPLLGIDGICIISHGRSTPKAISKAIKMAFRFAEKKINEKIVEELRKFVAPLG